MLGVLLVNLGTPRSAASGDVRRFLQRFLSDPRVVELPRVLWWPLLYGVIAPLRAPRSAARYREIWLPDGSPHAVYTAQLRAALQAELDARSPGAAQVTEAFMYSDPDVPSGIAKLRAAGARQIIVLPAFPQVSGTTTGAVFDAVGRALHRWRDLPDLRYVPGYADQPAYIAALAASMREHWQQHGRSQLLVMSFHGIPQRCVTRGDPYAVQCATTARLLAAALQLGSGQWALTYQSRFGGGRWLEPATFAELAALPGRGTRSVTVCCPGFSVDCLETLEEINMAGREVFGRAGGERFDYVAALNARPDHARALADLIMN